MSILNLNLRKSLDQGAHAKESDNFRSLLNNQDYEVAADEGYNS